MVLGACAGDDSDDVTITPSDTSGTSVTTAAPTTSAPPSTATSGAANRACPTGVGAGPAEPLQAARCLYAAWKANDRAAAAVVASTDAVDSLFRERWSPPDGAVPPCIPDPATGSHLCSFEYHDAVYHLDVRRSEGGWRVTQVQGPLQGH